MSESSSSSVWFRYCASSATLMKASARNVPIAAWIQVSRRRGANRPPRTTATIHAPTTSGSTSRSSFRSIGEGTISSIESNGTSQSTARKTANAHGRSRSMRPGVLVRERRPRVGRPAAAPPQIHHAQHRGAGQGERGERDDGDHERRSPIEDAPAHGAELVQGERLGLVEALLGGRVANVVLQADGRGVREPLGLLDGRRLRVDVDDRLRRPRLHFEPVRVGRRCDLAGPLLAGVARAAGRARMRSCVRRPRPGRAAGTPAVRSGRGRAG